MQRVATEVKNHQLPQAAELRRQRAGEQVAGEVEGSEARHVPEGSRDAAGQRVPGEVQRRDAAALAVAGDALPPAEVVGGGGGGVPRPRAHGPRWIVRDRSLEIEERGHVVVRAAAAAVVAVRRRAAIDASGSVRE